jgi:hypothetical protein
MLIGGGPVNANVRLAEGSMTTVKRATSVVAAIGALFAVACCLIIPERSPNQTSPFYDTNWEYLTKNVEACDNRDDIQQFTSLPNLVLFLDNDRAIQAKKSRIVMVQLHKSTRRRKQLASVQFRRVSNDLTGSQISDAVTEWLTEQEADTAGHFGGNGAVYWVSNGKVVATVPFAYEAGFEKLLQTTQRVFDPQTLGQRRTRCSTRVADHGF